MKNILNNIIQILTTNKAKAFYWQTVNGFVIVVATGLADIDWVYAPLFIAILNGVTKYLNTNFLK